MAHRTPVVVCVDGKYEPAKPSTFVCQPAAALIITQTGEMEVVAQTQLNCSMALPQFRNFSGHGRSASLLDNELVILGNDTLSGTGGNFITIQHPRDGLLAIKYTKESFPTRGSPYRHTALPSENKLTVMGGRYRTRAKLEQYSWIDINLKWEVNNEPFKQNFFSACTVKVDRNSFFIFGGAQTLDKVTSVRNTILHINTTSLSVKEVGRMFKPRMALGCIFLSENVFLLSGGYSDASSPLQSIEPDEIFNVINPNSFDLLLEDHSLKRFNHKLVRMNETIIALGGLTSGNATTDEIKTYNKVNRIWEDYDQRLKSKDTGEIVTLPFPISSLDCVPECNCGVKGTQRIFGGNDADVRIVHWHPLAFSFSALQVNEYPWIVAILREGETTAQESKCAGTLVCY